jgi:hypothetical protein
MKLRFLASVLLIAPAFLSGQDKGNPSIGVFVPNYTEIKQYLGLTDSQLQSLQSVLDSRNQAMQNIYGQINQKYTTLNQLMNSDNATAAQLGQIMLDIRNLQKQLPLNDGPYKAQALNVLTADQKTKLPKLSEALQLQTTAGQAGMLLLIDYPQYVGSLIPLAGTGAATGANGMLLAPPAAAPTQLRLLPALVR